MRRSMPRLWPACWRCWNDDRAAAGDAGLACVWCHRHAQGDVRLGGHGAVLNTTGARQGLYGRGTASEELVVLSKVSLRDIKNQIIPQSNELLQNVELQGGMERVEKPHFRGIKNGLRHPESGVTDSSWPC